MDKQTKHIRILYVIVVAIFAICMWQFYEIRNLNSNMQNMNILNDNIQSLQNQVNANGKINNDNFDILKSKINENVNSINAIQEKLNQNSLTSYQLKLLLSLIGY